MNRIVSSCFAIALILSTGQSATGGVLDVCSNGCDYTSIQDAINAAAHGDTIRVAQGTYNEILSLNGSKNLTIEGGWNELFTAKSADPAVTTINGGGINNILSLIAIAGDTLRITIEGFTVTGGQAFDGAGIHIEANGTDAYCHVSLFNNRISGNISSFGGGISAAAESSAVAILTLENNVVVNNRATQFGGGFAVNAAISGAVTVISDNNVIMANTGESGGGGLFLNPVDNGSLTFQSSRDSVYDHATGEGILAFALNNAHLDFNMEHGVILNNKDGGISIQTDGAEASATISHTDIAKNKRHNSSGAGLHIQATNSSNLDVNVSESSFSANETANSGRGGGIYFSGSSSLSTVTFSGNTLSANRSAIAGAGMYIHNSTASDLKLTLAKNNIFDNGSEIRVFGSDDMVGGGAGIAIDNTGELSLKMHNNIIAKNRTLHGNESATDNFGGGIYITNASTFEGVSVNNTIYGNTADDGGGGIYITSPTGTATLHLVNDIIYGNIGPIGADLYNALNSATIAMSYTDAGTVFGSFSDDGGNLNADPLLKDVEQGMYSLTGNSPAINAGIAFLVSSGDTLVNLAPDAYVGLAPDMGALESELNPKTVTVISDTGSVTFIADDTTRATITFTTGQVMGRTVSFKSFGGTSPPSTESFPPPSDNTFWYGTLSTSIPDSIDFTAHVTLKYTDQQLVDAGITNEANFVVFWFDSTASTWQAVDAVFDFTTNTATFVTNHFSIWALAKAQPTGITDEQNTSLPADFRLHHNRPNPFNPSTTISYDVPRTAQITLIVYNLLGQEVKRLVDEIRQPGRYNAVWDGTNDRGQGVASGVYLYRLAGSTGYSETKRMLLLK